MRGMHSDQDNQQKAKEYKHMTFHEAAKIAKEAEVEELYYAL